MPEIVFQFGKGRSGNAYLGSGWSFPETGFVWGVGSSSDLTLPIGGATNMTLTLMANLRTQALTPQVIRILIDDEICEKVELNAVWQQIELKVPQSDAARRRITIEHPFFSPVIDSTESLFIETVRWWTTSASWQ